MRPGWGADSAKSLPHLTSSKVSGSISYGHHSRRAALLFPVMSLSGSQPFLASQGAPMGLLPPDHSQGQFAAAARDYGCGISTTRCFRSPASEAAHTSTSASTGLPPVVGDTKETARTLPS